MKKYCLLIISFVLLISQNVSLGDDSAFDGKTNKFEQYLISQNILPSYQNYIIFSKKPVKKIVSNNLAVAYAYVMTTIDNVRDTVIVEARSIGTTKLVATVDNQNLVINVTVQKDRTIVETNSDLLEIVLLDAPSDNPITEGV